MIQTKLIVVNRWNLKYTNPSNDEKKEMLDLDALESSGASEKIIKEIQKHIEQNKNIGYRPTTYYQTLDSSLNEWLEKFHLDIIAKKRSTFLPDVKQPHIIDIKFAFAAEDGAAYPHALVIFEDGN
jgi:hypothetical protein